MVSALRTITGSERDDVVRLHVQESISVVEDALFLSSSGVNVVRLAGPSRRVDIDISRYSYMC